MVALKQQSRPEAEEKRDQQYSAAQTAKIFGITKRTLLKWEQQKLIPQPQRVQRGKLEYRAYSKPDIERIKMFIASRQPNSHIQVIGKDADGLPMFGRKLRGPSHANVQASRSTDEPFPQNATYSSLNEALGAACAAALKMSAKMITLSDEQGRTTTIAVRDRDEALHTTRSTPRKSEGNE